MGILFNFCQLLRSCAADLQFMLTVLRICDKVAFMITTVKLMFQIFNAQNQFYEHSMFVRPCRIKVNNAEQANNAHSKR